MTQREPVYQNRKKVHVFHTTLDTLDTVVMQMVKAVRLGVAVVAELYGSIAITFIPCGAEMYIQVPSQMERVSARSITCSRPIGD
jgi:hypothetical protein